MACAAGATLVWQGTTLDHIWVLNPRAYRQLAPLGLKAGIPLLVVAAALAAAGIGWFRRRRWAWRLAIAILITQILGDLLNLFLGRLVEAAIGLAAAGALLFYVLRPAIRAVFST
jgi:hypothetical protein